MHNAGLDINASPPDDAGGDARDEALSYESVVHSDVAQCPNHNHETNNSDDARIGAQRCQKKAKGRPPKTGSGVSEHQESGGALWDIFRREDSEKLQDFLRKHAPEFRHIHCNPVKQVCLPLYAVATDNNTYYLCFADQELC